MTLSDFARESIKQADAKRSTLGKAWRWFTTSRISSKNPASAAKDVIGNAGKALSKYERKRLAYISAGKQYGAKGEAEGYVKKMVKKHDVRKSSIAKPLLAGAAAVGAAAGVSSGRRNSRPGVQMIDRSPHLIQDPSRVVY